MEINHLLSGNTMVNWVGKLVGLLMCLQCVTDLHGMFMKFTNVTCESKDLSKGAVEYCEVKSLGKNKNSIRLRYSMLQPVFDNIGFHFQLMTKGSESSVGTPNWQPFLYAVNLDMCRFWKNRHNHLAKMVFEFIEGHSNLNHSCPYTKEKFIAIMTLQILKSRAWFVASQWPRVFTPCSPGGQQKT